MPLELELDMYQIYNKIKGGCYGFLSSSVRIPVSVKNNDADNVIILKYYHYLFYNFLMFYPIKFSLEFPLDRRILINHGYLNSGGALTLEGVMGLY